MRSGSTIQITSSEWELLVKTNQTTVRQFCLNSTAIGDEVLVVNSNGGSLGCQIAHLEPPNPKDGTRFESKVTVARLHS